MRHLHRLRSGWLCGLLLLSGAVGAGDLTQAVLGSWLAEPPDVPLELARLPSAGEWPAIYAARDHRPLWLDWGIPNGRARQLVQVISSLDAETSASAISSGVRGE